MYGYNDSNRSVRRCLLLGLLLLASGGAARAQPGRIGGPLTIAAASDLQTVLPSLVARFDKAAATRSAISFASSGTLLAQIQNGAPFDVFFSADADYPRQLVERRLAEADTLYTYATGRLVLWVRKDHGFGASRGLSLLRDNRVRRVAIANPAFAPYGRAAVAALRNQRLYDSIRGKLVFGENVAQAAQLAESGNVDAALLPHSLSTIPALQAAGAFADIPPGSYPPIAQAAVVVSSSKNKQAARALLRYLKTADARQMLEAAGFGPPPSTAR